MPPYLRHYVVHYDFMTKPQSSPRRGLTPIRALLASTLPLLIVLLLPSGVASAHTSFEQSTPADGATISEPLGVITLEFSGVSEPADDGFTVLTPDGQVRTPTNVATIDQKAFDLTFDPPLAGGQIGVRWTVSAPDAHPIDGVFSFTVTAPAATAATGASQTEGTPAVDSSLASAVEDRTDATILADGSVIDTSSASTSLDDFLAEQPARGGEGTARGGRMIEFAALTLLIGGGAFAATTLRGRRVEIDRAITVLRVLGLTLAAGALLEYVGVARLAQASIASYWTSQPGMATLLRGAGGLAVAVGLAAITAPVRTPRPSHSLSAAVNATTEYEREEHAHFWPDEHQRKKDRPDRHTVHRSERSSDVSAIAIDPLLHRHDQRTAHAPSTAQQNITISTTPPPRQTQPAESRRELTARSSDDTHTDSPVIRQWVLDRSSTAAYVGITVAVMSFWFDGHTVSKGPRPLHAIVNSVHVVAGSVWIGGVVAMAIVLGSRHRTGVAPRALEMIVRFSGIATVALGAVLAAGGIMAILILDSVGELFSTQWGQILLLKSAAVGLAMLGGAFNHFRVLPALEADPDDPPLVEHLRSAVTTEAILLAFVIVATASLVAAAS
jgi:putative copper export protein/methionine-rich copper-binding protein CopC